MAAPGPGTPDATEARHTGDDGAPGVDYRRFAGRAVFPSSPAELTDTSRCPACYTTLLEKVCQACKLDLSHPAAAEIADLSQEAATLMDERLAAIGRIRYDTTQARGDAPEANRNTAAPPASGAPPINALPESPAVVFSVPLALPPNLQLPRPADGPPETHAARPDARATAPRRSSVQVILLIVGISLLSVAAIFFLVYAFLNYGILGRSLIIAAVTIACFVIASRLRTRSLTATAEGIAALAVVLVYLDAFAIRANDFFGLGTVDGAAFWGAALLVTTTGFLTWHRLSGLRTPSIVGFAALLPGVALFVGGVAGPADGNSRLFAAFAAAALAGTAHLVVSRPATTTRPAFDGHPERIILLGLTGVALLGAFGLAATILPERPWASTVGFLVVAALAAIHAGLIGAVGHRSVAFAAPLFAALGGTAAAVSVASGALRLGDIDTIVIAPPVAATVVALSLELVRQRLGGTTSAVRSGRRSALVSSIAAATVAVVALMPALGFAGVSVATTVSRALSSSWRLSPGDSLIRPDGPMGLSVAALALCALMLVVAWGLGRTLRRRAWIPGWFGALILVVSVPLLGTVGAMLAGWLVVAFAALTALLWMRRRSLVAWFRMPLLALLAVSGTLGYLVGWATTSTWWIGSIVVVALLLACRIGTTDPLGRTPVLGIAALVVVVAASAGARQLALPSLPNSTSDLGNALRGASIVAIALLALCAFRIHRGLSVLDRRVLFWVGAVSTALSVIPLALIVGSRPPGARMSLLLAEPGTSLAADAALLGVLLILVSRPPASRLPHERLVASVALAPTLTLVLDQLAPVIGLPELTRSVGSIAAALIAAVGVLAAASIRARRPVLQRGEPWPDGEPGWGVPGRDRLTRELGILLVAVPSVIAAVARNDSVTWLVLVLASLGALAGATSPDGLFGSSSPRRQLGWVALALATAGLWWRLGDARVLALEPYVLPLAGALLVIALMVWRQNRSTARSTPDPVSPVIMLAGLLVAILPLAGAASTGALLRAVLVFAASAALMILGSIATGTTRSRPYLDSMALAGALGVLTVVVGRSTALGTRPEGPDLGLDAWLAGGLLVMLTAAFGRARDRGDHSGQWRVFTSQVLGALGLVIVLGFEVSAFEHSSLGSLRAIAVILLFSAVHVACFLVDRAPFTPRVGWIAISGAAVAVMAGLITGALEPVELGTLPVAAALSVTGALTLSRLRTARTWAWLAPATAVLLVPSLIATAGEAPVWRLVGLGVVGVAIIVVSAIQRLQAPFLIAVVVVLIHAIATFAPQIRAIYESVEWWLWFVPVGIAVVVFAARFEKSMLRMRSVAMRIRALR
ncbi:MAG: hypothetical protein V4531_00645 [Actinomycetota bacterium]